MDLFELKAQLYRLLSEVHDLRVETVRKRQTLLDEFNDRYDQLDRMVDCVELQIREALFIEYCNTPCWRYRC